MTHTTTPGCDCPECVKAERDRLRAENQRLRAVVEATENYMCMMSDDPEAVHERMAAIADALAVLNPPGEKP